MIHAIRDAIYRRAMDARRTSARRGFDSRRSGAIGGVPRDAQIVPPPLLPGLSLPARRGAGGLLLLLTFWLTGMAALVHALISLFD